MSLSQFMSMHGSKMGYLETTFLNNVYFTDYGDSGLEFITPEVEIDRNDGTNRTWRIDFVVETKNRKYAIECDGFNYHAPGMVSKERFNELEQKRNETVRQGFLPVSLSRDQIVDEPHEAIYQLRRMFNADPELYNIFLKRVSDQISPHEVQQKALEALEDAREQEQNKGLVVLATGLGKTYLSAFDAKAAAAKRILFVVHVDHILKQAKNSFEDVMPTRADEMAFFNGSNKNIEGKNIIFSTIQTLTREKNLSQFTADSFDYIIMDESHHAAAPSYKRVLEYFKPKFLLGLTATPVRMDEQDILPFYNDNLVFEMNQADAIKQGYLASLNYKGFKDNVDYSNIFYNGFRYDVNDLNKSLMIERRDQAVLSKFEELAAGKKTIGFCVSIEHAEWSANHFRKNGIDAVAIHSKIEAGNSHDYQTASEIIEAFDKNNHQVAFVVDMLNEGIDIPDVECLLMLRPTESNAILTQQIGRGLRIAPLKDEVLVLDFIGNYQTAPRILTGLGVNNVGDLKEDKEKGIYYYENEGRRVEFESEVVDIFKFMLSRSSRSVREELIEDHWKEYGSYLEENTKTGNSLFWSVGKKNNHLGVHLWALDFLVNNADNYSTNEELSEELKKASVEQFPDKTMEGIRALFFSKLIGLLVSTNPIKTSSAYQSIVASGKQLQDQAAIDNLVTNQLEKYYFWNDNFSLTNRHETSGNGRIRKVDELFHIYPLFFIYEVIIRLHDLGYTSDHLTKFEVNTFLALARTNDEVRAVVDRIMQYREHEEIYELEKYLKQKSGMDARFFKVLQYSKYFAYSPDRIGLKSDYFGEVSTKVSEFRKLRKNNKLIEFTKTQPARYMKLLFSSDDLITYHVLRNQ